MQNKADESSRKNQKSSQHVTRATPVLELAATLLIQQGILIIAGCYSDLWLCVPVGMLNLQTIDTAPSTDQEGRSLYLVFERLCTRKTKQYVV